MSLDHRVDHGCRTRLSGGARHPSPKFDHRVYQPGYDENARPSVPEDPMEFDYGFASHVVLWLIGLVAAVGGVATVLAMWNMGRQAYRKD